MNEVEEQVSKTCLSVYCYHKGVKGVSGSQIYPKLVAQISELKLRFGSSNTMHWATVTL